MVTRAAVIVGVVILIFMCVLAGLGVTALVSPLITAAALVVLVAGGNWLAGDRPRSSR